MSKLPSINSSAVNEESKKKKKERKEKLKLTIISFLSKKTQMEASLVQFVLGVNIR